MFTGLTLQPRNGRPHLQRPADAVWIADRIGQVLGGQYRIVRHLASGGTAHVFVGEHMQLGTYVVAKLPRPDLPLAATCLALEAELLARAPHPNIVKVFELVSERDGGYLLLEYVEGLELNAWLECAGALPVAQGLALLQQLAAAIDHLHAHGIVHGDVKPANVLFDALTPAAPNVKLIDFGAAFLDATHGQQRRLIGTLGYMAPEQCSGHCCGPAVDVYGFAALAYEVLTGHLICEYPTLQAALCALPNQSFWTARLDAVLNTGLQDAPEARFHSAGELVSALERAVREDSAAG